MEVNTLLIGLAFVGALLLAGGVLLVMLTVVGIVLTLLFFKTRQIIVPGVTLFILNLLEVPIRYVLWAFRVEEDVVSNMMVKVRNILYAKSYDKTPYNQRALFLPQCLRDPKCSAPLTPEGIKCMGCGRCGICKVKEEAEQLGYRVFIAPGGSLIKRMVKKYRPKAILGVGCHMEVKEGTAKMASYGLPVQGVILERDGCVGTRIDVVKLMEKIKTHVEYGHYRIGEDKEFLQKAVKISDMWVEREPADLEIVGARLLTESERGRW
jgi:hypothetical protein